MWHLFFGNATQTAAEVYARWSGSSAPPDTPNLALKGPYSAIANTLPSSFRFSRQSDLLWHATVVDPCFWSAESPSTYRLSSDKQLETLTQNWGIRRLGAKDANLWLDGRRWVFRAAMVLPPPNLEVGRALRESQLGSVAYSSQQSDLAALSKAGVPVAQVIEAPSQVDLDALVAASHAAALIMWVLPADSPDSVSLAEKLAAKAPNPLLAARLGDSGQLPPWAQLLICAPDSKHLSHAAASGLPVIAWDREPTSMDDAAAARRACEKLQQRLAPTYDLAGYWVTRG